MQTHNKIHAFTLSLLKPSCGSANQTKQSVQ